MNESNWSKQYQEVKNKDRMAKTFSGKNDFESRILNLCKPFIICEINTNFRNTKSQKSLSSLNNFLKITYIIQEKYKRIPREKSTVCVETEDLTCEKKAWKDSHSADVEQLKINWSKFQ